MVNLIPLMLVMVDQACTMDCGGYKCRDLLSLHLFHRPSPFPPASSSYGAILREHFETKPKRIRKAKKERKKKEKREEYEMKCIESA